MLHWDSSQNDYIVNNILIASNRTAYITAYLKYFLGVLANEL